MQSRMSDPMFPGSGRHYKPLNRSDPYVVAAAAAESRLYEYFDMRPREHYVFVPYVGGRVRVQEVGDGPPLLFVPGGPGDGWRLVTLAAALPGYRHLLLDRPGGGLSDGIDHTQFDLTSLAENTISAVLDHFRIERAAIVANSMGGLWTFRFSLAFPERVAAIAQLGTPALILNTSAPLPMRLLSIPGINRLLIRRMIPRSAQSVRKSPSFFGHDPDVGANWPDVVVDCAFHFMRRPTFQRAWLSLMRRALTARGARANARMQSDELSRVQCPVLFIWGENDTFGGIDVAHLATKLVDQAELHVISRGGHIPWWDDLYACAMHIRSFFERHVAGIRTHI